MVDEYRTVEMPFKRKFTAGDCSVWLVWYFFIICASMEAANGYGGNKMMRLIVPKEEHEPLVKAYIDEHIAQREGDIHGGALV
ncbi:MAG: hypothetical protein ACRDBM_12750 [Sporomusa sp.]